jgi:signal transduction histidine kinase
VLAAFDRLETPDGRFGDDDLRLAETFASRAAVAVDLSERVARDALRRVVAAQELERHRLARTLHEETSQALTSILLGLRALVGVPETRETVASLRELAVSALKDVRQLAVDLRPKALDDFGLAAAIERLAGTWSEATGMTIELAANLGDERLPSDAATALYRIVQEALTNVVKHAHARHVSVLLTRNNGNVVAVIEDDGRGFEPDELGTRPGIQAMRERLELLDGRLRIESSRGAGTTLRVELPLR